MKVAVSTNGALFFLEFEMKAMVTYGAELHNHDFTGFAPSERPDCTPSTCAAKHF